MAALREQVAKLTDLVTKQSETIERLITQSAKPAPPPPSQPPAKPAPQRQPKPAQYPRLVSGSPLAAREEWSRQTFPTEEMAVEYVNSGTLGNLPAGMIAIVEVAPGQFRVYVRPKSP